jgi:hypothetical protein
MTRTRAALATALLLAVTLLTACGGDAPTPTAVAPPTPAPSGRPFITYDVSGGIAGQHDVLEIAPGGGTKVASRGKGSKPLQLDAAELAKLDSLLNAANFAALQDRYDRGGVADDIYRSVTVAQGGASKKVVSAQVGGEGVTPAPLAALIAELQALLTRALAAGGAPTTTP